MIARNGMENVGNKLLLYLNLGVAVSSYLLSKPFTAVDVLLK